MERSGKHEQAFKIRNIMQNAKTGKTAVRLYGLSCFCGTLACLAVQFIPVLGGFVVLHGLHIHIPVSITTIWICLVIFAFLRAVLRYVEQRTNHYIAFTLLAIVRDKVFQALRKLCPAKLEGRDKGDLISLITSDVELLEVFYTHTILSISVAFLVELVMVIFIGSYHWSLGLLALCVFISVGVILPLIISKRSGNTGDGNAYLCRKCVELNEYARKPSDKCPFMENKTFCSNCKVHC